MSDLNLIKERFHKERFARRKAESLLNTKSNALYQSQKTLDGMGAMIDRLPVPILRFDEQGTLMFVNQASMQVWGATVLPGESVYSTFGFTRNIDFGELIRKNKSLRLLGRKHERYFDLIFKGVANHGFGFLSCIEITDYEQVRRRHAEAHRNAIELLASVSAALIGIDRDGRVIRWNATAEQLFEFSEEEMLGTPFDKAAIPWNTGRVENMVEACRETGTIQEDRIHYTRADGHVGTLKVIVSPITEDASKESGVFIVAKTLVVQPEREEPQPLLDSVDPLSAQASFLSSDIIETIQSIGDNIHFLDAAVRRIRGAVEKNREILDKKEAGHVVDEHIMTLAEYVMEWNMDYLTQEIPAAVEETQEMVHYVVDALNTAPQRSLDVA